MANFYHLLYTNLRGNHKVR